MLDAFMRYDSNAYNASSNPEVSELCIMYATMYDVSISNWFIGNCFCWSESQWLCTGPH